MKLQLIAAAVGSVLAFGAYAQSATPNDSTSGGSSNSASPAPSSCESLSGEEKTKCLQDEASSPSSTSNSSDSAAGGSSSESTDSTMPTDQTPASKSE